MRVTEYRIFQRTNPAFSFLAVARLKMKRFWIIFAGVRRYSERAVVLVIDANNSTSQSHATATCATHHLLFALKTRSKGIKDNLKTVLGETKQRMLNARREKTTESDVSGILTV